MAAGNRISIVTDEVSQDLGECRAFLDETGITEVELRCASDHRIPELSPADLDTLGTWGQDGIQINALSPGIFKGPRDDVTRARDELKNTLPRTLELAAQLGVDQIIAFTFENPDPGDLEGVAAALAVAATRCADAHVRLLIENEPGFSASTARQTEALLDACNHPNLFVNWDPANSTDRSEAGLTDAVARLGPRIKNVHVKNGRSRPQDLLLDYGPLADGEVDWPAHLRALASIGYDGPFGIETHFTPLREASHGLVTELRAMLEATGTGAEGTS